MIHVLGRWQLLREGRGYKFGKMDFFPKGDCKIRIFAAVGVSSFKLLIFLDFLAGKEGVGSASMPPAVTDLIYHDRPKLYHHEVPLPLFGNDLCKCININNKLECKSKRHICYCKVYHIPGAICTVVDSSTTCSVGRVIATSTVSSLTTGWASSTLQHTGQSYLK